MTDPNTAGLHMTDTSTAGLHMTDPVAAGPTITTDPIIQELAPPFDDRGVVLFEGWMSGETADGKYRLFTSPRMDQWLEIPKDDLLFQIPSSARTNANESIVWVRHDAMLVECHKAKACHLAEAGSDDPTSGAKYPKYPA